MELPLTEPRAGFHLGVISELLGSGAGALVELTDGRLMTCAFLISSAVPIVYAPGDRVLVCMTDGEDIAVINGRIPAPDSFKATPETMVIEARESITLRVGDGSITIHEDGRILIKGRDLVSQAKRRNRIRGGSVEIN